MPIFDPNLVNIGYEYYQLISHPDGYGHLITRFMHSEKKPRAGILPHTRDALMDPTNPLIIADNPFLARLIQKAEKAELVGEYGPAVISANGLLGHGLSGLDFRCNEVGYGWEDSGFTPTDAETLVKLLYLDQIPLTEERHVTIFLERDWLHLGRLDNSMALLQQMLALRSYITAQGASVGFVMPPEVNPDGGPTDLAHLIAQYGLIYCEDSYLRKINWPGFDVVS